MRISIFFTGCSGAAEGPEVEPVSIFLNNANFHREGVLDALFLFSLTSFLTLSSFSLRGLCLKGFMAPASYPPQEFVILLTQTLSYFSILITRRQ